MTIRTFIPLISEGNIQEALAVPRDFERDPNVNEEIKRSIQAQG